MTKPAFPDLKTLANAVMPLYARVEALEADALEQSKSQEFCLDHIIRRLEKLEAAQRVRSGTESPLVERVADAIAAQATSAGIVNDRPARAAILEVAAWLTENYASDVDGFPPHQMLRDEVNQ